MTADRSPGSARSRTVTRRQVARVTWRLLGTLVIIAFALQSPWPLWIKLAVLAFMVWFTYILPAAIFKSFGYGAICHNCGLDCDFGNEIPRSRQKADGITLLRESWQEEVTCRTCNHTWTLEARGYSGWIDRV